MNAIRFQFPYKGKAYSTRHTAVGHGQEVRVFLHTRDRGYFLSIAEDYRLGKKKFIGVIANFGKFSEPITNNCNTES
jgi:hypothetical protein